MSDGEGWLQDRWWLALRRSEAESNMDRGELCESARAKAARPIGFRGATGGWVRTVKGPAGPFSLWIDRIVMSAAAIAVGAARRWRCVAGGVLGASLVVRWEKDEAAVERQRLQLDVEAGAVLVREGDAERPQELGPGR